jgi:hypothetical protein
MLQAIQGSKLGAGQTSIPLCPHSRGQGMRRPKCSSFPGERTRSTGG